MDGLRQDLRFAIRSFRKSPGFTVTAIVALAIGIGANTTVFSFVDALVFRPPPFEDADRLVVFWEENPLQGSRYNEVAPRSVQAVREGARSFEQIAAYDYRATTLTGPGEPEHLAGLVIDANLLPMLGVEPVLGRNFTEAEDAFGAPNVVLISHSLWQRRFGGSPDILGRTIMLFGFPNTVVGVMPADFHFAAASDIWMPLGQMLSRSDWQSETHMLRTVAKLRRGVSMEQAKQELDAIAASLERDDPQARTGWRFSLHPINEGMFQGPVRPMMLILLGAVGFVLLIACADVANLLLARGAGRGREIAIRSAMGAGRARLVRQLLTESLLLAAAGGIAGTIMAVWVLDLIRTGLPANVLDSNPRMAGLSVSLRILASTAVLALATGVLFGFLPALRASRTDLTDALKQGGRSGTSGRSQQRLRAALVGIQAALAVVLLTGATILMRSFLAQQAANPSLRSERLLTMRLEPRSAEYFDDRSAPSGAIEERLLGFHRAVVERIAALPEVADVAITNAFPLSGEDFVPSFAIVGRPAATVEQPRVSTRTITPGYLSLLGVTMRSGREFAVTDREDSPPVAIVSESFARAWLPGEDPIGRRIDILGEEREIVGVVADIQDWRTAQRSAATVYLPLSQFVMRRVMIVVRTRGEPAAAVPAIRRAVFAVDAAQPVFAVRTMRDVLHEANYHQQLISTSMTVFALIALILAAVGLYGVMAYSISQRTHELGIRTALGARPASLVLRVVAQGMRPVLLGLVVGTAGAVAIASALSRAFWAGEGLEATSLVAAIAVLMTTSLLAAALPARRASRVHPIVALHKE